MCVILFAVSQRTGILRLVNGYFWTPLCHFIAFMHFFSQSLNIVLQCGSQLLNVLRLLESQVCSVARLCRDQSFGLCHRHNDTGLSMLCKVNSNSHHCLFGTIPSASAKVQHFELRPQLIHWSLKYQGVERPNWQGFSCRHRFECGMTFPTLCLIQDAGRVQGCSQSTVGCFSELYFVQFSVAQELVGLRKQFIKNCFSHLGLCCWF